MTTGMKPPGPSFTIQPLADEHAVGLARFVASVPDGDRRFLKEDFGEPAEAFHALARNPRSRRFVAVDRHDAVIGLAGVFPETGWSSHVAELRVLVAPTHRRHGVGRALARAALLEALTLGCTQAYVEVVAKQGALVTMFQDMGFSAAALLPDFVRDADGEFHDLLMLTHRAEDQPGLSHLLALDEVAG